MIAIAKVRGVNISYLRELPLEFFASFGSIPQRGLDLSIANDRNCSRFFFISSSLCLPVARAPHLACRLLFSVSTDTTTTSTSMLLRTLTVTHKRGSIASRVKKPHAQEAAALRPIVLPVTVA